MTITKTCQQTGSIGHEKAGWRRSHILQVGYLLVYLLNKYLHIQPVTHPRLSDYNYYKCCPIVQPLTPNSECKLGRRYVLREQDLSNV